MAKEKQFENRLKDHLKDIGAWYIKYWAGATYTKEGIPDLLICHNGSFIAIEVKAPTGKPSLLQLVTLRKIREAGGIGILLYPDDFMRFKTFINGQADSWYKENIAMQNSIYKKLLSKS